MSWALPIKIASNCRPSLPMTSANNSALRWFQKCPDALQKDLKDLFHEHFDLRDD